MNTKNEHGQAAAMTVLFMTVLLLSAAAVIDVGSWFREDRDTQRVADAAALAGAQALPESTSTAQSWALEYADKNGQELSADNISFDGTVMDDDTINVTVERAAPGFFAQLAGIESITVGSKASARAGVPSAAKWVAPIVVNERHEKLVNRLYGEGNPTSIELEDLHGPGSGDAAGAFGLLNLEKNSDGAPGASSLAAWMSRGFSGWMRPGTYRSAPSALFNSSEMSEALRLRTGTLVLFPVCRARIADNECAINRGGQNAQYDIIGWVAFRVTGFNNRGSNGTVDGYFEDGVIWEGILSDTSTTPDFGVRSVSLIK